MGQFTLWADFEKFTLSQVSWLPPSFLYHLICFPVFSTERIGFIVLNLTALKLFELWYWCWGTWLSMTVQLHFFSLIICLNLTLCQPSFEISVQMATKKLHFSKFKFVFQISNVNLTHYFDFENQGFEHF